MPHVMKARIGVPVVAAVVVVLLLGVHAGWFNGSGSLSAAADATPADVRGAWTTLVTYDGSLFVETLHITEESSRTGRFSGTVASPVGTQSITGTAAASDLSFMIRYGTGVESGVARISTADGHARISGTFVNGAGGGATILATRPLA